MARFLTEHGPWRQLVALNQLRIEAIGDTATCEPLLERLLDGVDVAYLDATF